MPEVVLSAIKAFFEQIVPEPNEQNISTQIGIHFEEFAEGLEEITPMDDATGEALRDALVAVSHLATWVKSHAGCIQVLPENRVGFLDAICDQLVTGVGSAHMLAMDPVGGLNEVNRSNYSKFGEDGKPIFNENLKMIKGPNYSKPDLTPFV